MTQALAAVLRRPTTPEDTLGVLTKDVGFSDQELSRALAVTDRSIKRWRANANISTDSLEKLYDIARIVATLSELGLRPANVHAWFFHRNAFLDEERPIDVFAAEGFPAIRPALAAIADAAYA